MTLIEIVHSESYLEDGLAKVRVEIEQPVEGGSHAAECILPEYKWQNVQGSSEEDTQKLQVLIASLAHIIIQFA